MAKKILVVYGSRYGGTAEIAEEIGKVLKQEQFDVDVQSADHIGNPSRKTRLDTMLLLSAAVYTPGCGVKKPLTLS